MKKLGKYSHLITFNTVVETADGMGGFTEGTTAKYSNVWGNVKTIKGQRLLDFQQLYSGIWYEIDFMQDPNKTIYPGDTVTFNSQVLTIHQAMNINEDDWTFRIIAFAKQLAV